MNKKNNLIDIQKECCSHYEAVYSPVGSEQMVAISEGVYEGQNPVEGIRYNSPEHMSGWWLTTDSYRGDINSIKTVHFKHIAESRPDLAVYMALPTGYRFSLGGENQHVWFDETVATAPE